MTDWEQVAAILARAYNIPAAVDKYEVIRISVEAYDAVNDCVLKVNLMAPRPES